LSKLPVFYFKYADKLQTNIALFVMTTLAKLVIKITIA